MRKPISGYRHRSCELTRACDAKGWASLIATRKSSSNSFRKLELVLLRIVGDHSEIDISVR